MPKQKDLKRRVRERMQKTGESYAAARSQLLRKQAPRAQEDTSGWPELAGTSDEAVRAKTGRTWAGWVRELDREGAAALSHPEIVALVSARDVPGWWAQTVTVGYERIRGLRAKGQRRAGGWDVGKSKTCPVPVERLFAAFSARRRARWLGATKLKVTKSTPSKSMRIAWEDGTRVDVHFWPKGAQKSQVQVQHGDLPSRERAEELRAWWTERLAALHASLTEEA